MVLLHVDAAEASDCEESGPVGRRRILAGDDGRQGSEARGANRWQETHSGLPHGEKQGWGEDLLVDA